MATAASLSYSVSATGETVTVPNDDVARLMYYLNCVTVCIGLDILQDDLVDFRRYYTLSPARKNVVISAAIKYSPDVFIDKFIFKDDEGEIIKAGDSNEFVNITTACRIVSIQSEFALFGQNKSVTKVMFYKSGWMSRNYFAPMQRLRMMAPVSTRHCGHCDGKAGLCECSTCPRDSKSECTDLASLFLDVLLLSAPSGSAGSSSYSFPSAPSSSTYTTPTPPAPPAGPQPGQHRATCDGCLWRYFTGPRFKCTTCVDYDLCHGCYYSKKKHVETEHQFKRYEASRPTDSPIMLLWRDPDPSAPPQKQHWATCGGCQAGFFEGPRFKCSVCEEFDLCGACYAADVHFDAEHHFRRYDTPEDSPVHLAVRTRRNVAPPPPYAAAKQSPSSASAPTYASSSRTSVPATLNLTHNDAKARPSHSPSSSMSRPTPDRATFFCDFMSIEELRLFLIEHAVDPPDDADEEALCKLVWDVHVDAMTTPELDSFISTHNIFATGLSIDAKKQKAKEVFGQPAPSPSASSTSGGSAGRGGNWKVGDEVVLTALGKKVMNGKRGTIQEVDGAARKVTVFVSDMGRPFKVKFENVEYWVEELGADLPDQAPEELE